MTDPLDHLKGSLDRATPETDPARKRATLAQAMEAFDAHQGSEHELRQKQERPLGARFLDGATSMIDSLKSPAGLMATTALVAVGVILILPNGDELLSPPAPEIVGEITELEAPLSEPVRREVQSEKRAGDGRLQQPSPNETMLAETHSIDQATRPRGPAVASLANQSAPIAGAATSALLAEGPANIHPAPVPDEAHRFGEDDTEAFANTDANPLKVTQEEPVSTFSIDVDTASYGVVRSSLMRGQLPPADAVRIEEMINYFPYDYAAPEGVHPFATHVSVIPTPWNEGTRLVHIGIQGERPAVEARPPLNLVFLIDTSESMQDANKLPLLVQSFRLMLSELRPEDEVAIVTYAGSAGQVLDPTTASERDTILAALDALQAGGSTAGQAGLQQAYSVAQGMANEGEVSRVILATDGDFNVGLSDPGALKEFIAGKRDSGTYLSVLGFGRGNLDDATMQALAQNGNGQAAYIDTLSEAQKVLVDQLTGALFPIANDVKIQIEFNPAEIAEYRLIGYETRALSREDFNNDQVDAGDIGAGHSISAIYEVTPVGSDAILTDPLRYQAAADGEANGEYGYLKLRYKSPGEDESVLIETPIAADAQGGMETDFAVAVAGFGQLLRRSPYLGNWAWPEAIDLANRAKGDDPFGYRAEAITLMRLAESLAAR